MPQPKRPKQGELFPGEQLRGKPPKPFYAVLTVGQGDGTTRKASRTGEGFASAELTFEAHTVLKLTVLRDGSWLLAKHEGTWAEGQEDGAEWTLLQGGRLE